MTTRLLVHGGPIMTMDPTNPQVDAVGMINERIVATGRLDDVRVAVGSGYDDIDLQGRTAVPGFIDAHAHVMGVGYNAAAVNVTPDAVSSIRDIREKIAERAATVPPGTWIEARGFDQGWLAERRIPTRHDLDDIAPNHPVVMIRACHHIVTANSRALELAGITSATPDTPEGTIDRDEHGEPTGVLREAAALPVYAAQGEPTEEMILAAIERGGQEFRRHGVTSVAEAGIRRPEEFRAYQRARQQQTIGVRTWLMMMIDETLDELISLGITTGFGDDWFRIGNAKLFVDGSIGGRTARMTYPYESEEANLGLWMEEPETITGKLQKAHAAGFQLGNHAIGDGAIELLIESYERAQREHPVADPRFRIEHCSIMRADLLPRLQALGAVPIPGTTFLYDFRQVYDDNLGRERIRYAYAMRTYEELGIVAAASTDAPVCLVNPMLGVHFMVNRTDRGDEPVYPEERVSLGSAIRAYTRNGAYSMFGEGEKGSLAPGMLADMAVLNTDLEQTAPDMLRTVVCDLTIADGRVVYDRADS